MLEVRAEPVVATAVADHIALASTTYSDPLALNTDHFWWKHGLGPAGRSTSINLYDGGKIVGRSVIQPRLFRVDPQTLCRAGLVVDLMLAPTHRSAVNFMAIVRGQSKVPDLDVLLHTSNETSDPLYRKFLRYPVAFNLKAYGFPIRAHRIASKLLNRQMPKGLEALFAPWRMALRGAETLAKSLTGLRMEAGLPSEREFDEIMRGFRAAAGPHLERSRAFLEWRFQQGPFHFGNFVTFRSDQQALGYFVWRKVRLEGLEFLVLMDIAITQPATRGLRYALWLELTRLAIAEEADVVFTMINPENPLLGSFVGGPLLAIPDDRLPHPTPIFMLPKTDDLAWLRGHGSTYMTLADIDYF